MASCAVDGGCPTDYIAVAFSLLCITLLISRSIIPFVVHKIPRTKGSGFWIPVIIVFAGFNLLLAIVVRFGL